jgi:putative oxidoreductase
MNFLSKFQAHTYTLLRVIAGIMFSFHGIQKLFGVLSKFSPEIGSQMWIGGVIEFVTGVLIIIGFQTRIAAFLASGTMAVAYIQFHWKFQFDSMIFPTINKGELALLYAFVFLFIACKGSGKFGLDSLCSNFKGEK